MKLIFNTAAQLPDPPVNFILISSMDSFFDSCLIKLLIIKASL